ncbi:MAG: hypothetical protein KKE50_00525 [Nanoarchaeota archaeon]|nr:hypothetical protein [Nanoarchaeota archaeon]
MLTKTQLKVMQIFTSKINEKFSIKQISEILKKTYPLIHRSIQELIQNNFVLKDNKELLSLNYKENHQELAYIESSRAKEFLNKNKTLSLFIRDALENLKSDFFILLVFGSSVEKEGRDTDLLFIFNKKDLENNERVIRNTSENFTLKLDINAISVESAYEMLSKRDNVNVLNETLNKHVILFGAENYYRILKNARQ